MISYSIYYFRGRRPDDWKRGSVWRVDSGAYDGVHLCMTSLPYFTKTPRLHIITLYRHSVPTVQARILGGCAGSYNQSLYAAAGQITNPVRFIYAVLSYVALKVKIKIYYKVVFFLATDLLASTAILESLIGTSLILLHRGPLGVSLNFLIEKTLPDTLHT